MNNQEKVVLLQEFIARVDAMMENLIADCTGFYVPETEFRQFKKDIQLFFDNQIPHQTQLIKEFNEMVTEGKKHKMLYAKVILQDILNELTGNISNLRN